MVIVAWSNVRPDSADHAAAAVAGTSSITDPPQEQAPHGTENITPEQELHLTEEWMVDFSMKMSLEEAAEDSDNPWEALKEPEPEVHQAPQAPQAHAPQGQLVPPSPWKVAPKLSPWKVPAPKKGKERLKFLPENMSEPHTGAANQSLAKGIRQSYITICKMQQESHKVSSSVTSVGPHRR